MQLSQPRPVVSFRATPLLSSRAAVTPLRAATSEPLRRLTASRPVVRALRLSAAVRCVAAVDSTAEATEAEAATELQSDPGLLHVIFQPEQPTLLELVRHANESGLQLRCRTHAQAVRRGADAALPRRRCRRAPRLCSFAAGGRWRRHGCAAAQRRRRGARNPRAAARRCASACCPAGELAARLLWRTETTATLWACAETDVPASAAARAPAAHGGERGAPRTETAGICVLGARWAQRFAPWVLAFNQAALCSSVGGSPEALVRRGAMRHAVAHQGAAVAGSSTVGASKPAAAVARSSAVSAYGDCGNSSPDDR